MKSPDPRKNTWRFLVRVTQLPMGGSGKSTSLAFYPGTLDAELKWSIQTAYSTRRMVTENVEIIRTALETIRDRVCAIIDHAFLGQIEYMLRTSEVPADEIHKAAAAIEKYGITGARLPARKCNTSRLRDAFEQERDRRTMIHGIIESTRGALAQLEGTTIENPGAILARFRSETFSVLTGNPLIMQSTSGINIDIPSSLDPYTPTEVLRISIAEGSVLARFMDAVQGHAIPQITERGRRAIRKRTAVEDIFG